MAPTKPSKRPSLRSKTPRPSSSTTSAPRPTTKPTKKAKLLTRKTTFLSKIEKASTKASARSRRRKNKALQQNLVTELDSLADALDDVITSAPAAAGTKSISSRPGAMKRKEAVVRDECERFGKNLAIMQAGMAATQVAGERPSTWVALRGFIEGTMERKEEFVKAPAAVHKEEEEEEMVL